MPRPFLFVHFYVLVVVGFLLWFPHVDVVVLVLVVPVVALGLRRRSEAQLKREQAAISELVQVDNKSKLLSLAFFFLWNGKTDIGP